MSETDRTDQSAPDDRYPTDDPILDEGPGRDDLGDDGLDDRNRDDDLFWEDADDGGRGDGPGPKLWLQLGVAAVVVAIIVAVLISRGSKDEADTPDTADPSGQTAGAGGADTPEAPKPRWPSLANGRPAALGASGTAPADVPAEAAPGVYVWNDFEGWHLWVVNGEGVTGVSGTITSNDAMQKAVLDVPGTGTATATDKTTTFSLPGDVRVSGVSFNPGFYGDSLGFDLQGPNGPIEAAKVLTGSQAAPATAVPLTVTKAIP